jgi:glycolate oxidase FAD binding subunit
MLDLLQERIAAATRERTPLEIVGGGTKRWLGEAVPAPASVLSMSGWSGIEAYEPSELVVTVRAGTPLATLESELAAHGQMLAFEPPRFGTASTVGGAVAAGLSGPRRFAYGPVGGAVRDFVLGARVIDGRGHLLRFGGTVMKNVAGYDVSRLLAGSLGVLGVITEISIKVLPRPTSEVTLQYEVDEHTALRRLNQWAGQPMPVSGSAWCKGLLRLRLSGSEPALRAARTQLGGEFVNADEAGRYWAGLRDQTDAFFQPPGVVWRFGLPPTAAPLGLDGDTLIEWNGGQRFVRLREAEQGRADMHALAARAGGHATRWRNQDGTVFSPMAPAVLAIHQRIKAEFDPAGIFNPARLHPAL